MFTDSVDLCHRYFLSHLSLFTRRQAYQPSDLGKSEALAGLVNDFTPDDNDAVVWGGMDIEPGWSGPSNVLSFVSAYDNTSNYPNPAFLFDFGELGGNTNATGSSYDYANSWTPHDLYDVTYGDLLSYLSFAPPFYAEI